MVSHVVDRAVPYGCSPGLSPPLEPRRHALRRNAHVNRKRKKPGSLALVGSSCAPWSGKLSSLPPVLLVVLASLPMDPLELLVWG